MYLLLLLLLASYIPLTNSANILTVSGVSGSHYFLPLKIAEFLASHGHNVTFLSATAEKRVSVDSRLHYITPEPGQGGYSDSEELYRECIEKFADAKIFDMPSETMGVDYALSNWETISSGWDTVTKYRSGDHVRKIIEDAKFDVIIAEEYALAGMLLQSHLTKTPFVLLRSVSDGSRHRQRLNMPDLISSEPRHDSHIPAEHSPGFMERGKYLYSWIRVLGNSLSLLKKWQKEIFSPHGVENIVDLYRNIELILVNDHPALSFPYLMPASVFYIAGIHFNSTVKIEPLPGHIQNFVRDCSHSQIIYISFGSYVRKLSVVSWMDNFLDYLLSLDACFILKAWSDIRPLPADRFLVLSWVPQRDLLGSGVVSFFLSHCGNNGRIEAVMFRVPLLCLPLFADQLTNAVLVKRNGHGIYMLREELSLARVQEAVTEMGTRREEFVRNMDKAVEIITNGPESAHGVILFYIEQLVKYGNLDYLRNEVILGQSTVEIYNLDIWGLILLLVFATVFLLSVLVIRMCNTLIIKVKTE